MGLPPRRPLLALHSFLRRRHHAGRPLLLAFSGGGDSTALLALLLELKTSLSIDLHVAHLDHSWRAESRDQALKLKDSIEKLGLPFHLSHLPSGLPSNNAEERGRKARDEFFRSLCDAYAYQAVLLAHHRDDRAETVLKRLFEGASLARMTGPQAVSVRSGLTLWRPLLDCRKDELLPWAARLPFAPIEDPTNLDPAFLRSRLRQTLLPQLSGHFGKEIVDNLARLGTQAEELDDHLNARTAPALATRQAGSLGVWYLPPAETLTTLLETKAFVQRAAAAEGLTLPAAIVQGVSRQLLAGAANKRARVADVDLWVDRGRLFFVFKTPQPGSSPLPLTEGDHAWGDWRVQVTQATYQELQHEVGWQCLLMGRCRLLLPPGDYTLDCKADSSLGSRAKRWSACRVPAFVRAFAPLVYEKSRCMADFFTAPVCGAPHVSITLTLAGR